MHVTSRFRHPRCFKKKEKKIDHPGPVTDVRMRIARGKRTSERARERERERERGRERVYARVCEREREREIDSEREGGGGR